MTDVSHPGSDIRYMLNKVAFQLSHAISVLSASLTARAEFWDRYSQITGGSTAFSEIRGVVSSSL